MADVNVEFIVNAAGFAQELATQLNVASNDEDKATALARLNLVLNDIVRAANGELGDDGDGGDEEMAGECCSVCAVKYKTNPAGYQNCVMTCNHGC